MNNSLTQRPAIRRSLGTAATFGLAATLGLAACGESTADAGDSTEGVETPVATAQVTEQDLVETITLSGTLGYGETTPLPTNTTGVVTAIPEEGDVIEIGEVLFEVNGRPIILMEGVEPQWRPYNGRTPNGPDIEQLEQNLIDLGFAEEDDINVDDDITTNTLNAIEDMWDTLLDDDPNDDETPSFDIRQIDLGQVVFSPVPIRIAQLGVTYGTSINPAVTAFQVTETQQIIIIDADPADRALLDEGTKVTVELPGGEQVSGTITSTADVATRSIDRSTGSQGDPTIEVQVTMDTSPDGAFDAAPVDVIVTESTAEGVLTVPSSALIALSEGGHAVEVLEDAGSRLVRVETGSYADGRVEVTGDLADGDTVVVPG